MIDTLQKVRTASKDNAYASDYGDISLIKDFADRRLGIKESMKLGHMSKGTLEKTQLVLTMSRDASLFCLDEPIGGVDPATRDYILQTIINNYSENATVLISTHLIADIENTLDDVIFLQNGQVRLNSTVDEIRAKEGQSVDSLFREVFRC